MPVDPVLPHDLDSIYGPGAEQAEMADISEYEPVKRDYTLRLYRSCPANDVEITRNGITRKYGRVREPRINAFARIIRKNRIDVEIDFMYFTEIQFQADKE